MGLDDAQTQVMATTLTARSDELLELKQAVADLRKWMAENTKVTDIENKTDVEVIKSAQNMMSVAKTAIQACWPVIRTLWENVSFTLRQAGVYSDGK